MASPRDANRESSSTCSVGDVPQVLATVLLQADAFVDAVGRVIVEEIPALTIIVVIAFS
jgi:hypothetical protein